MMRRIRSPLAIRLAALALCATFAAPAAAQRGGNSGDQAERPPPSKQARPQQQRPAQQQQQPQGQRPRNQDGTQDDRRASAARNSVRPYEMRPGHLRERMAANGGAAEIQRGMLGEVNVNRDRLARIERLRRIYEARKDQRQLRRLEQLKDTETRRYRSLMSQARGRLSEEEYRRFLDRAGDPQLADQIESREQERRQDQREEQP